MGSNILNLDFKRPNMKSLVLVLIFTITAFLTPSSATGIIPCNWSGTDYPATWDCCTISSPCGQNEGDCDSDEECSGNLLCGSNNCESQFSDAADCCYEPNPTNPTTARTTNPTNTTIMTTTAITTPTTMTNTSMTTTPTTTTTTTATTTTTSTTTTTTVTTTPTRAPTTVTTSTSTTT